MTTALITHPDCLRHVNPPGHPELRSADTMARELDAELREARSMKKPDWGVEVAYQRRGREFGDMVSVMLMVDLPIFQERRQDPQVSAKLAEREGIEAERDAMRRELTQMLDDELAMLQRERQATDNGATEEREESRERT